MNNSLQTGWPRVLISQSVKEGIPRKRILRTLQKALEVMKLPANVEVSVHVVGARAMRTLNARHRGKDDVTDVLSFPQFDGTNITSQIRSLAREVPLVPLGDIVLHMPRLRRDAPSFHRSTNEHIAAMVIHSFLHLLGYDHVRSRDRARMELFEKRIHTS